MRDLLEQIRQASTQRLYYAALFPALSLPDICGALESLDGDATGARYKTWFDSWVAPSYYGLLTGEDCYYFRCSLLHQGTTQHKHGSFSRIIFVEPGTEGLILHNNVINDALTIDVQIFCEDLCAAVERWLPGAAALAQYGANMARFISRYPTGLAPYIVGVPVIG